MVIVNKAALREELTNKVRTEMKEEAVGVIREMTKIYNKKLKNKMWKVIEEADIEAEVEEAFKANQV